jgi:hypothetical protein
MVVTKMKSIENFTKKIKMANSSRSKELRLTMEEAVELCADLNLLLKKQLETNVPTVQQTVKLNGGKF